MNSLESLIEASEVLGLPYNSASSSSSSSSPLERISSIRKSRKVEMEVKEGENKRRNYRNSFNIDNDMLIPSLSIISDNDNEILNPCMSESVRMWVGVDAEWRAVINHKGRDTNRDVRDEDGKGWKDGKLPHIPHGAATLQV